MAFDVVDSVNGAISAIKKECSFNSNIATLRSGILTLRKIGKSICLADDTLGHEVRKHMQCNTDFVNAMLHLVKCFDMEERPGLLEINCDGSTFEGKLKELEGLSGDMCIFEGLDNVRQLLAGEIWDSDYDSAPQSPSHHGTTEGEESDPGEE